jgi:hypothetical protein
MKYYPDPRISALVDKLLATKKAPTMAPADATATASNPPMPNKHYSVFGQQFSRINEMLPRPVEKTAVGLLSLLARLVPTPDDAQSRFYRQAVLDRRTAPFTEKDLSADDMRELAKAVGRSEWRRQYARYAELPEEDRAISRHDYPSGAIKGSVANALGKADWRVLPDSGVRVTDTYDFNNDEPTNLSLPEYARTYFGGDAKAAALWLGRRAVPEGRGVPVDINIPPALAKPALRDAVAAIKRNTEESNRLARAAAIRLRRP